MLKEVRLGNGCAWTNIVLARQNMFSFTCKSLQLQGELQGHPKAGVSHYLRQEMQGYSS